MMTRREHDELRMQEKIEELEMLLTMESHPPDEIEQMIEKQLQYAYADYLEDE